MLNFTSSFTLFLVIAYAFSLSLPITVPWTILVLGIIIMLLNIILRRQIKETIKVLLNAPLIIPIALFLLAITISGIANGGTTEGIKSFISLRGMLVYVWAYWAFSQHLNLKEWSVAAMLTAGALAGLSAAIEQLTGLHPFSFPYLQGTGFLSGPMAFSGLTQIFSLLALGLFLTKGYTYFQSNLSNPRVFVSILICNFLGLLFAAERSAWLGAIVAIFVISFLISRRTVLLCTLFIIVSSIITYFSLPVVKERILSLLDWQKDVSVNTRIILWDKAWEVFKHSPIFGVGIRNFPHLRITEALQQGHVALDHAHSNYLHMLATTGLVGFTAYLYLWISVLITSYKNQKDTTNTNLERSIYLGIFGAMVSLAVSGLFEYNFGTGQIRLAEWFLLAMLTNATFPKRVNHNAKN